MKIIDKFFGRNKAEQKQSVTSKTFLINMGRVEFPKRDAKKLAQEGYQKNVIAFACIDKIARGAASCPLKLLRDDIELADHPLLGLLRRPNPLQGQSEFFEAVYAYRQISGNSFIEAAYSNGSLEVSDTTPTWLYTLRPDRMKVIAGANRIPAAYQFEKDGLKVTFPVTILGKSNILQLKTFNPLNDWYGMSPIEAAALSVDLHNESNIWNNSLLQNGARPSGALTVKRNDGSPQELTIDQFSRLKNQIDEQYSGSINAGRPLLLEGGLEWQEMSLSPKDMDFISTKNMSARDIALVFGVPAQLINLEGGATYNNMLEAKQDMWISTIIPLVENVITELNYWLVPRFGNGLKLVVDKDNIEALTPMRTKRWQRVSKADFLSPNEKRKLLGLDTISGGDVL